MERTAAAKRAASLRKKYLADGADLSDLTDERVKWIVEYVVNSPAGPGYIVRGQMKDMEEMIGALLRAPGLHPEIEVVENRARLITEIQKITDSEEEQKMAPKREYLEHCPKCNALTAKGTNEGVHPYPLACKCKERPPGPQMPPRIVPWRSATLIGNGGKIRWLHSTIFVALEDDAWHPDTIHEIKIVKGLWYWLDETWSIGDNRGHRSMLEAEEAQKRYGAQL